MAQLDKLLAFAVESGASDLHISVGIEPRIKLHGQLRRTRGAKLTSQDTKTLLLEILNNDQKEVLRKRLSIDFCYEIAGMGRFRANVFVQRLGLAGVFRVLPKEPPTLADLRMPPVVEKLLDFEQGLILVTGPAGCGKTTTLGAMIHHLNASSDLHIITVEDPVEIVHRSKKSVVTHREVHVHTSSFSYALRAALREDPDVILVGEMRDLETISMAITAAETGHLVLATLHTASAARTINRIIDVFPPEQMSQIRAMVSESIRGVISQQLLLRADNKGMVMAMEIMLATPAIAHLIRENRTYQIPSMMQIATAKGMRIMDESLLEFVRQGIVSGTTAYQAAENKAEFLQRLKAWQRAEEEEDREQEAVAYLKS